jgi:ABC-type multidrug transport system fused ATPase/permease subunit
VVVVYLLAIGRPLEGALAMVGTYAVAAYRLLPALQAVFATASHVRFEMHALEQIHRDVTTAPSLERPVPADVPFTRSVELAGVTFRYPTATTTLFEGLDLVLEKGRWTAFVGSTGSGKTTLADLVMGLLLPTSGEVRVDGRPLRTTPEVLGWQRHIGYVPQAIFMSDDTVAHNIAFGHVDADRERIRAAAHVAAIDEFVERELANGWDTPVGERGIRLSGGQRQRLGLARALYERPDLLVLDEATSALDNETEKLVMERLRAAHRDTTVLMVAHRLSTTRHCDEILLLERGRTADRGTYDELLARSPLFRDLVQAAET